MSKEEKTKFENIIAFFIGGMLVLIVVVQVGIALFGDLFEADKPVMKHTVEAQNKIRNALLRTFNNFGRLEVREDYSVHAYISKKKFMKVDYPDRYEAIATVGKAWCEDKGINRWYLPKVVLRDIQTGEYLSIYRCLSMLNK